MTIIVDWKPRDEDDGYWRYGPDVIMHSRGIFRRLASDEIKGKFDAGETVMVNIYGSADLATIDDEISAQEQAGHKLIWHKSWPHPAAGTIQIIVFEKGEVNEQQDTGC